MLLNTSLLRERFTLQPNGKNNEPLIALGNRITLPLSIHNGQNREYIIIRAHSMHAALRMAAQIYMDYRKFGPIINRASPSRWEGFWEDATNSYDTKYNPNLWCSVYHGGHILFKIGEHHPFLDVIEQCDARNRAEYDNAIKIAEAVFKDAGKPVKIDHDINIATVIGADSDHIRCGLILRIPQKTTTFNFHLTPDVKKRIDPDQGLNMAADYLEAIQLSVKAGFLDHQIRVNHESETSPISRQSDAILRRIGRLTQSIQSFENVFQCRYRPEKPDFKSILAEAKQAAIGEEKDG